MTVKIFHNPRCSKSRATLELLRSRGIEPEIVRYLDDPPTVEELAVILDRLGRRPRELIRKGETEYRDQDLADPTLDDATLIRAMVASPRLIERPIVLANGRAAVGRPPEAVLAIL